MSTPTERIASGLDRRDGRPSLSTFVALQPGADGRDRLPSPSMLRERAASARSKLSRLQDIARDIAKAAQAAREAAEHEVHELRSDLSRSQRRRIVQRREAEARRKRAEHYGQERESIMAALRDYGAHVDAYRSLWGSPASLLTSRTLGSEKAARFQSQLSAAGESQLAVALRTAAATGNADLLAAALACADSRGFRVSDLVGASRDECCEAVLGTAWTEVGDALDTLSRAPTDAITLEREISTGRRDPLATVGRGLRDRADGQGDGDDDGGEGDDQ